MASKTYEEAAVEVLEILKHINKEHVNKIPKSFIQNLKENKSNTYVPNFDFSKPFKELQVKPKTEALLGLIYLKYWADEEGKKKFEEKIKRNSNIVKDFENQNKVGIENLFVQTKIETQNIDSVEKQEKYLAKPNEHKWYDKIISKIIKIFKIKGDN